MLRQPVWLVGLAFLFAFSLAGPASAQTTEADKSYSYKNIDAKITINEDSTVLVEEKIVFDFTGNFHTAWRNINLDKISAITDVVVLDGETLMPLTPSNRRLDKLASDSWGKYTSWQVSGNQNIEWYFNLTNTTHSWILHYVVHGAITFGDSQDRLYWDMFTDYSVPVAEAHALVKLPQKPLTTEVVAVAYSTSISRIEGKYDETSGIAFLEATNFKPYEDFTIDIGWPKGLASEQAFWQDWLKLFWGYLVAVLMVIVTIVAVTLRWYVTEKSVKGRGTIVPQYEPPQELKPAMAEIICKERLTNQGLTATIVNLAIRGYITIAEDFGTNWLTKLGGKQYKLIKKTDYSADTKLEDYERQYLDILFSRSDTFSTREVKRWSNSDKRTMYNSVQELKKNILKETELDTKAYIAPPSKELLAYSVVLVVFIILLTLFFFLPLANFKQIFIAFGSVLLSAVVIGVVIKYEARLSLEGRILKEDWLGFKMFLETAERYRLQNLTPQTFEKFLPYAMIFGIEKKWAQAFAGVNLPNPSWYAGAAGINSGGISGASAGFSAATFSASFSSSFTSAFASSAGGSAGGGGAGGGGGGGGGGAG